MANINDWWENFMMEKPFFSFYSVPYLIFTIATYKTRVNLRKRTEKGFYINFNQKSHIF